MKPNDWQADEIRQALKEMRASNVLIWNRMDIPPPGTPNRKRVVAAWFGVTEAIKALRREFEATLTTDDASAEPER